MYEKRLKTIKKVCEKLNLQTKPELRIKNKRQDITSHKPRTRRIPKWCICASEGTRSMHHFGILRVPSDAQIVDETELHYLVRH